MKDGSNSMKAIILAAGQGTRINSNTPKCFISVKGITILERQIEILQLLGVDEIKVVVGNGGVWTDENQLKASKLKGVETIVNKRSLETQSPYSMLLGMGDEVGESLLVIDGDIVLEKHVLGFIAEMEGKSVILVKRNIDGSGSKVIIEEDSKKSYYLSNIGEQLISDYVYAGVLRLDSADHDAFKTLLQNGKHDTNYLSEPLAELTSTSRIECVKLIENKDTHQRYGHVRNRSIHKLCFNFNTTFTVKNIRY